MVPRIFTPHDLIAFETSIASEFNSSKIKAPVHLSNGGETDLINIFSLVDSQDFVFSTWRSHYHALLKGVDEGEIIHEIMNGRSITLNFPDHNFFSSAIAGTQLPVAVGTAYGIKMKGGSNKVWCFVGDMVSESGICHSAIKYAENFDLPITFVIEDNNLSVCSDTRKVWNSNLLDYEKNFSSKVISYKYTSVYPHAGAGKRVEF
jgi:TPP-dependent pyruvate/acetoin dehydrogenase alpha subunit